jgi:hypothetical protein
MQGADKQKIVQVETSSFIMLRDGKASGMSLRILAERSYRSDRIVVYDWKKRAFDIIGQYASDGNEEADHHCSWNSLARRHDGDPGHTGFP